MEPEGSFPCPHQPSQVPTVDAKDLVQALTSYVKINFNTSLSRMTIPWKWSLPFRFVTRILHTLPIFPISATRPAHHNLPESVASITFRAQQVTNPPHTFVFQFPVTSSLALQTLIQFKHSQAVFFPAVIS
jgi:hypothetical protein